MTRRRGLIATLAQIQREAARAEAAGRRAETTSRRQAEQARLRYARAAAADERERKRLYAESRAAEVEAMNADLAETVTALDRVLAATLDVDNYFDLDQLHRPADPGRLAIAEPPPVEAAFRPPPPRGLSRMIGNAARHEQEVQAGRARSSRPALRTPNGSADGAPHWHNLSPTITAAPKRSPI
jgi:restriction system protein